MFTSSWHKLMPETATLELATVLATKLSSILSINFTAGEYNQSINDLYKSIEWKTLKLRETHIHAYVEIS